MTPPHLHHHMSDTRPSRERYIPDTQQCVHDGAHQHPRLTAFRAPRTASPGRLAATPPPAMPPAPEMMRGHDSGYANGIPKGRRDAPPAASGCSMCYLMPGRTLPARIPLLEASCRRPEYGILDLVPFVLSLLAALGDKGWIRERIQRFRPSCGDFLFTHNPLTFHATSEKIDFIESRRLTVPGCWRRSLSSLSGSNSVVECNLAKVEVAGSNPVSRSSKSDGGVAKW